jgi:hypothetical protein
MGDPLRLTLLLFVFGVMLIAPKAAVAQQPTHKNLVGRRVVQRTNDFTLHVEDRVIDRKRVIHFYRVEPENGPWLWVRAEGNGFNGWALYDHVVAVEDSLGFFTDQIRDDPQNVFPCVMRAMLWQDRKEIDKALRDYDEVLRLDPSRGGSITIAASCTSSKGITRRRWPTSIGRSGSSLGMRISITIVELSGERGRPTTWPWPTFPRPFT